MDIRNRLLAKRIIDSVTNCWLYIGPRTKGRNKELKYGQIKYKGKNIGVHRLALEIFKDIKFEENEQANHTSNCPNMHCFNPEHLYKGSQKDNMNDKKSKYKKKSKFQKNQEYYRRHNQHRKNFGRE